MLTIGSHTEESVLAFKMGDLFHDQPDLVQKMVDVNGTLRVLQVNPINAQRSGMLCVGDAGIESYEQGTFIFYHNLVWDSNNISPDNNWERRSPAPAGFIQIGSETNNVFQNGFMTFLLTGTGHTGVPINDYDVMRFASDGINGRLGVNLWVHEYTLDVSGDLNVRGNIYINGTNHAPDYVFEKEYALPSIEDHAESMWRNKNLPAAAKRTINEKGLKVTSLVDDQMGILEELETAHIYIHQLSAQNKKLQQRLQAIETKMKF